MDYKMIDFKIVILHEIHSKSMVSSETFQVAAIINKLSPDWKDFKN